MPTLLIRMRAPGVRPRAGAHDATGMKPDKVWHAHDLHQLIYAFDGAVEIEDAHARFLVPSQLAAWIPAGVTHRTYIQAERSGSVFLPPSWVKPAGDRIKVLRVAPLLREMVLGAMRWPIHEPVDAVGQSYFKTFALLCREWLQCEAPLHVPTTDDLRLGKAMHYTRDHLAEATFAGACRAASLSERSLRRRFLSLAGMSWTEYRHRSRLLKAMSLLERRRRSIGDVAAEVGFESVSAFSKAFSVFTGESPRRYRDRLGR